MSEKENKDNGGPAYPWQWRDFHPTSGTEVVREQGHGMSIWDKFFQEQVSVWTKILCRRWDNQNTSDNYIYNEAIRIAAEQADAMLAERKRRFG